MMTQSPPEDLIPMTQATQIAEAAGLTRRWIELNVKRWELRGRIHVSRAELENAIRLYNTPKPKD